MREQDSIDEQIKKFLVGLEKLTRETGVVVKGCGCCGSPWLQKLNNTIYSDVDVLNPEAGYSIGNDNSGLLSCLKWEHPDKNGSWNGDDWDAKTDTWDDLRDKIKSKE